MNTEDVQKAVDNQVQEVNEVVEYFKGKLPDLVDFGIKLLISIVIFFIGKKIIKLFLKLIKRSFMRAGLEEASINFMNSLVKAILYIILISGIAVYLGISGASIAALLGSMGLGIVLALKESLSNLAGGFILLIMKPFSAGDYIKEDEHKNEGTVTEIDLFYTTLLTPDNRTISLPNGILANTSLTNISRQEKRQLREIVGIAYEADIKRAKAILADILKSDQEIISSESLEVFVDKLGERSVEIGFRGWVRAEEYWTTKYRIIESVKYEFDKAGIEIPYKKF